MANSSGLHFTDEEIQEELRKLGYINVSDELFKLLKEDLSKLIEEEDNGIDSPVYLSAASQENNYMCDEQLSPTPCVRPIVINKSNTILKNDVEQTIPKVVSLDVPDISIKWTKTSAVVDVESSKENVNDSSSSSLDGRIIKRKVLRHRNGQTVISEESSTISRDSGNFCKSKYSALKGSLSSEEELSHSVISLRSSSENISEIRSQSQTSYLKPHSRSNITRKCDPVTRYHQYRQYWEAFKPPGEKSHKLLRWTIREKMLKYDFV